MERISGVWAREGTEIVCTRGCPAGTRFPEQDIWRHNSFHNNIGGVLRNISNWTQTDKERFVDLLNEAIKE